MITVGSRFEINPESRRVDRAEPIPPAPGHVAAKPFDKRVRVGATEVDRPQRLLRDPDV